MNWTSIITTFVICGSAFSLAVTITVKIIGNKVRKQLPECVSFFAAIKEETKEIKTEMESMKKHSTDRMSLTLALQAAMKVNEEQYKELHTEFKQFSGEVKEIFVKLGEIGKDIKYMSNDINEIKKK